MHGIFLLFDGLDQFELGAAAVEVMAFAGDFVIGVSGEVVG